MAYFRPIDTTMDEEQVQLCRKEKLRCACPPTLTLQQAGGAGQGTPAPPLPWEVGPNYSTRRGHC